MIVKHPNGVDHNGFMNLSHMYIDDHETAACVCAEYGLDIPRFGDQSDHHAFVSPVAPFFLQNPKSSLGYESTFRRYDLGNYHHPLRLGGVHFVSISIPS